MVTASRRRGTARVEAELRRRARASRISPEPEDVQRAVMKLVLSLVELVRKLMERQALRRVDEGTLTPEEIERVGLALMRLEETLRELCDRFGIPPEELVLDLGPLGRTF